MAPHWPYRRLRTPPGLGSPSPPGRCARFSAEDGPPFGLAGGSEHLLGRTPRPPQAGAPGSLKKMAPRWPGRRLRTPPGQDSPSPPGRCARFSEEDGPPLALQETPNTPWAGLPIPPGRWAPFVHPGRPCRKLRPPPGLGSPSPQAGVPGSTSPQALQETPTTPWAGLPIPPGRCARFYVPTGPAGRSDHPLGRTPRPPRPMGPVVHPRRPCRKLRPPLGLDSPSPQAGVPGSTSLQALQDAPTTPWAGLPVPPGRCARIYLPTVPVGHSDHPLGRTPHPPRPVCPDLPPHTPRRTLRPPPGQDSPSPQAGGPGCPSPQALQETPTTPWAGLPIPPGRCARFYVPTGPAGHSDHPLGRTPRPPRAVGPVVHPRRPCGKLPPPPGLDSPSP